MKEMTMLWMAVLLLLLCAVGGGCNETPTAPTESVAESDKLDTPVIQLNDNVVSWELVKNADYYAVFINDVWKQVVRGNEYVLDYQVNGQYEVQIYACDSFKIYKSSEYSNPVTYVVERKELAAPVLSLEGELLSWNDVEGASSYDIYVNGIRKADWMTRKVEGTHTCELTFSEGGTYQIYVKAVSEKEEYERESDSNTVVYKYSTDKRWYAAAIDSHWELYGNASLSMQWIHLNKAEEGKTTGLTNRVLIDGDHSYLYLTFDKLEGVAGEISPYNVVVTVDGAQIAAMTDDKNSNIPDNVFVYDLKSYIDKIVDIRVELISDTTMALSQIRLFTKNNVSTMKSWEPVDLEQEWIAEGKTVQHAEGFCLECENGNTASVTNMVHIGEQSKLEISFRKFLRIGGEDLDPKVYVYVDDVVVAPENAEGDYASVSMEAYTPFTYDLSKYAGQDVEIKVVSAEGEHACFSSVKLTN